jgi:hypothetical protein
MQIYESPDKGKTIYKREFGSLEKTLIKSPQEEAVHIPNSELIEEKSYQGETNEKTT